MIIPDQEARDRALATDTSFIVQAPAGSGKTELLIQRFLSLLTCVEKPEEIIAITFTRKAALEMRQRIMEALKDALTLAPQIKNHPDNFPKTLKLAYDALSKAKDILSYPQSLKIMTIDSLAAYIVKKMPLLSQLGNFTNIIDNPLPLYQKATRSLLDSVHKDPSHIKALQTLLLQLDNNYIKLEYLLCDLLNYREQWLEYILLDPSLLKIELEKNLWHLHQESLEATDHSLSASLKKDLQDLLQYAAQNLNELSGQHSFLLEWLTIKEWPVPLPENIKLWKNLTQFLLNQDKNWRKIFTSQQGFPRIQSIKNKEQKQYHQKYKILLIEVLEQCKETPFLLEHLKNIASLPPLYYSTEQWNLLSALFTLLPHLVAHLQLVFQEEESIDYTQMSQSALLALGPEDNPTDLGLSLDYQIKHLLIDEFQDTSAQHFRLIERLTAGWYAGDNRTLFIVGDPLQSIYRFRKAEVSLFLRVQKEGIGNIYLESLYLKSNFRSQASIVQWINKIFPSIFSSYSDPHTGKVAYHTSQPTIFSKDKHSEKDFVYLHPLIAHQQAEAEVITSWIKNQLTKNKSIHIAILVRAKNHATDIIEYLKKAQIDYEAPDIEPLLEQETISDLLALTKAFLYPADRIAWLSILRAPWCGLQLKDLYIIANSYPTILESLLKADTLNLSTEAFERIQILRQIIQENRERKLTLAQAVLNAWKQLSQRHQEQNIYQEKAQYFFYLLFQYEKKEKQETLIYLEEALKKPYILTNKTSNNSYRIEIMTIHKAKGLEFDIVILPKLEKVLTRNTPTLFNWMEKPRKHKGFDLFLAPIKAAHEKQSALYQYIKEEEYRKIEEEARRLLYVATTRAKDQLHLFVTLNIKNTPITLTHPTSGSFLDYLWHGIKAELEQSIINIPINKGKDSTDSEDKTLKKESFKRLKSTFLTIPSPLNNLKKPTPLQQPAFPFSSSLEMIFLSFKKWIYTLYKIKQKEKHSFQTYTILMENFFTQSSLPVAQYKNYKEKLEEALFYLLNHPQGQWLIENHVEDQWNLQLDFLAQNQIHTLEIDRSFMTAEKVYWYIFYSHSTEYTEQLLHVLSKYKQIKFARQQIIPKNHNLKIAIFYPFSQKWYIKENI